MQGFLGGLVVKDSPAKVGDTSLIPGLGRSPGEGNGNPLQYSCLKNPMDRGASLAIILGVARVQHDLVTRQTNKKEVWSIANKTDNALTLTEFTV